MLKKIIYFKKFFKTVNRELNYQSLKIFIKKTIHVYYLPGINYHCLISI